MIAKVQEQPYIIKLAAALVAVSIFIYGLHILADVIIPFAFASILAILLLPLCNRLEKFGLPRALAITVCILLFMIVLSIIIYFIVKELLSFEDILPQLSLKAEIMWRNLQLYIRDNFHITRTKQTLEGQKYLTEFIKNNSYMIGNTVSFTTNIIVNFVLIPIYVFLFLYYRNFFHTFLHKAFGEKNVDKVNEILINIKSVILNYIVGLLTVILIVGVLDSIGLLFLGIDYAMFFGFFAGLFVLIPYIGIIFGATLPILMALITKDSSWYAIGVAIIMGTVQFVEGNFITPYVVGSKVSLNAMASIVALLLFGKLWGMPGLILAIPLTAIIRVICDSVDALKPLGFLLGNMENMAKVEKKKK